MIDVIDLRRRLKLYPDMIERRFAEVVWVLDAFVWTNLIPDGDHAIATRVFDFLVEPHNANVRR